VPACRTARGSPTGRSPRSSASWPGFATSTAPTQAQASIDALVAAEPDADAIAARLGQLLGVADGASTAAETAWAIRRFLAARTADRPLLMLVDDVHWAEPMLLELLSGLPTGLRESPILVVCLARPELLEGHPTGRRRSGSNRSLQMRPASS